MSSSVWRNRPLSGSSVNPSTPDPMVNTRTVLALQQAMISGGKSGQQNEYP